MIYFTSDLHFYHPNIINYCGRPFENYEHMHRTLIRNWNNTVGTQDSVYILGDFMIKGNAMQANQLLKNLNGEKYMIRGNHDCFIDMKGFDVRLIKWIKYYYKLCYKNYKFVLFHYPILNWEDMHDGSIHLYGHIHNKHICFKDVPKEYENFSYNVGVDCNNYLPVSIEQIIEKSI